MQKKRKKKKSIIPLVLTSGILLIGAGASTLFLHPRSSEVLEEWTGISINSNYIEEEKNQPSAVLPLAFLKPEERQAKLIEIASGSRSLDRSRARYLLASDLIAKYEGGPALRHLEGLERQYPILAPYILLKRGRAYQLTNENEKAKQTWEKLIKEYPDSEVVAEALYMLGEEDTAIAEFPNHPRTLKIIRTRLEKNPNDFDLLLLLAKYERSVATNQIRDRLVQEYSDKLNPQDWEAIASGYWQYWDYHKAAYAYSNAPINPQNLYRTARGMQLSGQTSKAKRKYQQLSTEFPDAKETGLGLRHLASLSSASEAIAYLNIVIEEYPDEAPEALLEKTKILEKIDINQAAKVRQTLLDKYPDSNASAAYRWSKAQRLAESGQLQEAIEWAKPIMTKKTHSDVAPIAAFWVGKWQKRLGREADAKAAFEYVIVYHPQSYYAWRSAVQLGWEVGDFTDVRKMTPEVTKPTTRPLPPAGSEMFKELYLLGQDEDAQNLFVSEIGNRQDLTVAEQFTEALLKQLQGKYRESINGIWTLKQREEPQDKAQWQALRETPEYWQALFPFPYYDTILKWSKERELNPLLVISLIRQESTFEPDAESPVGATGLMQVMPATAKWIAEIAKIEKYTLDNPEDNIMLGTWYFDHTHDEYDNNSLFAVASYNAGPGNVSKWKKRFSFNDPDVFVKNIPFPETENYVESVFGNYWNYLRIYNPKIAQLIKQESARG